MNGPGNVSISAVIPSYNGRELLKANLPFLIQALEKEGLEYEIIVSDDASSDGTVEYLKKEYPGIIVLSSQANQGFSPTINRGIERASKQLVMLLNNDIRLSEDYFASQLVYFGEPDTFGVMGKIIGYENEAVQDAAKYPVCALANIKGTVNYELVGDNTGDWLPTFMLSGANSLVDAVKLKILGGYCEIFAPFNWEDMDLSLRAWRLGWKCYYEPQSVCRHRPSSTIGKHYQKREAAVISARNKMLLHYLHLNGKQSAVFCFRTAFKFLTSFLFLKTDFYRSLAGFIEKIPQARLARRELEILGEKQCQLLSVAEVCRNIKEKIKGLRIRKF
jgi:GT2 family glycosyltransferase